MTIEQMQTLCDEHKIGWSLHAAEMMMKRSITRSDVLECIQSGEIIEDYPSSFPHPSCLVFGRIHANKVLHTVIGIKADMLIVITAYYPDTVKFESDLKTRRTK